LGARARALTGIDVAGGLRHLLPWPEAADLAHLAPERLAVPSGSTARIDYPDPAAEDGRPVVAVKLQEVFGLAETPRLVRGRVPGGRYPQPPWPEAPGAAPATARTSRGARRGGG